MSVPEVPEWAPVPDDLGRLAAAYGVATEYWDQAGNHVHVGSATVAAVLASVSKSPIGRRGALPGWGARPHSL